MLLSSDLSDGCEPESYWLNAGFQFSQTEEVMREVFN